MNFKIVNIMGLVVSALIFIILSLSLVKSISRIRNGDNVIERTKAKVDQAELENKKLEDQLKLVQSEEFIEKQLRDKMGLAREGEIVLILSEASIVKKLTPQIPEEIEAKPKPNWLKWMELFK